MYEAFDSNVLNSVNKFLSKQINKESVSKFNKDILSLGKFFNFMISDLNNDDISYLKYNDAIKIKGTSSDLFCIKYWFSSGEGYLGYTGTSDVSMEIAKGRIDIIPNNKLNSLSRDYNIKGRLVKCSSSELKTGDYIVLYMGEDDDFDYDRLAVSIVFKEGVNLYAIQDKQFGSTPNDESYKKYGRASWCIGTDIRFGNDHSALYKIEVDDTIDALVYVNDKITSDDPFTWNLQLDSDYKQMPWVEFDTFFNDDYNEIGYYNEYDDWISNIKDSKDIIKDATFAIIVYMKNIETKSRLKPLLDLRKDDKINAIALLNDEEFRNSNISRYVDTLFTRFNIKSSEYSNINKLVVTLLKNEYAFIEYLKQGSYSINYLSSVLTYLSRISTDEDDESNEKYYLEVKKLYQIRSLEYSGEKNKNIPTNNYALDIYNIYLNMGKNLVKYLKSNDIRDVYELRGFFYKIKSMFDMHGDSKLYDSSISNYFKRDYLSDFDGDESSVVKAKNMEKAVNAILR